MADQELRNTIKELLADELKKKDEQHSKDLDKLQKRLERKRSWDQTTFSKKGHEEQFKHVAEVLENVDDALEALEKNDCEAATTILKQGKELLEQRIQILKLADREGWMVVRQYQQNLLFSSGEVKEKQLKDARKAAESIKRKLHDQSNNKRSSSSRSNRMDEVICYNCKRVGHFSTYCPFVQKESPKLPQISQNTSSSSSKRSSGYSTAPTSSSSKSSKGN